MKSNAEYWKERAAARMTAYHKQAEKFSEDITQAYAESTKYINREVRKIFKTFTMDSGLSEKEARRLLQNVTDKNTLKDIKKALKTVKDVEKRKKLLAVVNAPAYAHRIKRLEQLKSDIDMQTKKLCRLEDNLTTEHYIDLSHDAYARAMFDLQKGTNISFSFAKMPVSRLVEILNNRWSGKLYSDRIWGRTHRINAELKKELLVGFMTGRSYRKTAKNISETMQAGAMEARRLVHTESTYIANSAELESYKESGIKKFRFLATLDMRTSEICASMDGKEFDVADGEVGVNIPPLHPWCRSTTVPVIDSDFKDNLTRIARDPKTGKNYKIPADTTYEQWKKSVYDSDRISVPKMVNDIAQDDKMTTLTKGADSSKINLNRTVKRRTKNLSNFSNLEVTMQKRNVLRTADKYDVSTKGLTFKIQRSEKLLSMPYYGSTDYDNIGRIDLFPNAFVNEEQLIRTILHEKCHVKQLQKYGKNYVQANIPLMERQAERFEKLYYQILKKRVK